jgi:hypothetical protein
LGFLVQNINANFSSKLADAHTAADGNYYKREPSAMIVTTFSYNVSMFGVTP